MLSSVALIRPKEKELDARYLMHWLNSPDRRSQMLQNMSGAAIKRLILAQIRRASVPIPPLDKQRRIAAILDQADDIRRKRRKTNERLDELTKAIFVEKMSACFPSSSHRGRTHAGQTRVPGIKYFPFFGPVGVMLLRCTTRSGPMPQWDTSHEQHFRSCIRSASLASCKRHREAFPGPTRKEMLASRRWSNKTPVRTRSARKRRGGGPSTWLRTVRHRLNSIGNRRMAGPSLWARTL